MRLIVFLLAFSLAGCSGGLTGLVSDLNDSAGELLGIYSAPTLAGYPRPSGCSDQRCRTLDDVEEKGYGLARQRKITWVRLVDTFYQKRAELYPNSQDGYGVNELRTYQRALAEQMDIGKVSESQWAYFVERKNNEINSRNRAAANSAPRQTNCTTTNIGSTSFPQYKTICN